MIEVWEPEESSNKHNNPTHIEIWESATTRCIV